MGVVDHVELECEGLVEEGVALGMLDGVGLGFILI